MKQVLAVLAVVLAGVAPAADKGAVEAELKRLEGTWEITSAEARGRKLSLKDLGMDQVVVRGDKLTFRANGKDVKTYGLKVDPSKDPKQMDWTSKDSDPLAGIYELKGDDLMVCWGESKDQRPTALSTKKGSGTLLLILKRGKP